MTSPSPVVDAREGRVVIAGFGAAGLATVETLRREGFGGTITVLSAESHLPYDRPPLSKQYLAGSFDRKKIGLTTAERLEGLDVRVLLGRGAAALDLAEHVVRDDTGELYRFDALVIATGVRARTIAGAPLRGVHKLRTAQDADGLRAALRPGTRFVIVGGGFLGLEVAATAVAAGAAVTVIEPSTAPLENRIGAAASRRLIELHRQHGVDVLTGVGVRGLSSHPGDDGGARVTGVVLTTGEEIAADEVLVAIGSVPNVAWLEGSGVVVDDGIVCDEFCAAAPGIYAVGDVARWSHQGLGRHIRLEHRMNAVEQATAVARTIMGVRRPFVPVPFFWTDQYDARIQVAGTYGEDVSVVVLSTEVLSTEVLSAGAANEPYAEAWYRGSRLVGVLGWNAAKLIAPSRRELARLAVEAPEVATAGSGVSR